MKTARVLLPTLLLVVFAVSAQGQHSFTPEEIAGGGQLYRTYCLDCHGPAGNAIANAPVMDGKFRRGNSDEELVRTIRNGISGTNMTAQSSLTETQALTIVGFLRSVATAPSTAIADTVALPAGNASRGKNLFEGKGNCLSCHQVNGVGSVFGPDLSGVGNPSAALGRGAGGGGAGGRGGTRGATATAIPPAPSAPDVARLQQSILDPDAALPNNTRYVQLVLRDGTTLIARLLNQDTYALQVLDFRERLRSIPRSTLRSDVVFKSPMPSYRGRLTNQELADLLSYLITPQGQSN